MSFSPEQTAALSAKLHPDDVKSRTQAGRAVNYIEGWHAIAEANRIFGFDGWDRETTDLRQLGEPREVDGKWRVGYMARVRVTVRALGDGQLPIMDVVRDGCGYGSGIDKDLGAAHESALKEAETDAMKRALMTFGNPFGLALYDKSRENVGYEPAEPAPVDTTAADMAWLNEALSRAEDEDKFTALLAHKNWKGRYDRLPTDARKSIDGALASRRYKLGIGDKPDAEANRLVQLVAAG